ncbi:MAG: hypothetical protein AAFY59_00895 [Pseudomonadota bacterium]
MRNSAKKPYGFGMGLVKVWYGHGAVFAGFRAVLRRLAQALPGGNGFHNLGGNGFHYQPELKPIPVRIVADHRHPPRGGIR